MILKETRFPKVEIEDCYSLDLKCPLRLHMLQVWTPAYEVWWNCSRWSLWKAVIGAVPLKEYWGLPLPHTALLLSGPHEHPAASPKRAPSSRTATGPAIGSTDDGPNFWCCRPKIDLSCCKMSIRAVCHSTGTVIPVGWIALWWFLTFYTHLPFCFSEPPRAFALVPLSSGMSSWS